MKNEKQLNDLLQPLENIRRVEASPYLLTRIQEALHRKERFSPGLTYLITGMACLLVVIHVMAFRHHGASEPKATDLAQGFQLIPHNDLYR